MNPVQDQTPDIRTFEPTEGPWIGVDLDGTLAQYDGWKGPEHIGDPVPLMLARVKQWLSEGKDVRIFTARVGPQKNFPERIAARRAISHWCAKHLGVVIPVTHEKDFHMVELWDDRCVQVIPNTGRREDELAARTMLQDLTFKANTFELMIMAANELRTARPLLADELYARVAMLRQHFDNRPCTT